MAIELELVDRTMHLSAQDRAELARRLILSLEPADVVESEEELAAAWSSELERRLAAYDKGQIKAVDWRDAVDRAKAAIQQPSHK